MKGYEDTIFVKKLCVHRSTLSFNGSGVNEIRLKQDLKAKVSHKCTGTDAFGTSSCFIASSLSTQMHGLMGVPCYQLTEKGIT